MEFNRQRVFFSHAHGVKVIFLSNRLSPDWNEALWIFKQEACLSFISVSNFPLISCVLAFPFHPTTASHHHYLPIMSQQPTFKYVLISVCRMSLQVFPANLLLHPILLEFPRLRGKSSSQFILFLKLFSKEPACPYHHHQCLDSGGIFYPTHHHLILFIVMSWWWRLITKVLSFLVHMALK